MLQTFRKNLESRLPFSQVWVSLDLCSFKKKKKREKKNVVIIFRYRIDI